MTERVGAKTTPGPAQQTGDPHFSVDLAFRQAAPQGFGDRHNSWAWSMQWWRGKLYVGTNRAWHCAEHAAFNAAFPLFFKYPPKDPDAACTPVPFDLPLQAEIWCWTPETDTWERLYQSPRDVPIPKQPGRFVARETGYRYMTVFTEPDGTEALYVSGVNARFIWRPVPAPRILRSIDGRTFEPLPQDPGTFMGDLDKCSFRTLVTYRDRLYVHVGSVRGEGILLESSDPARGNDTFRQVSPQGMQVFEMLPYNGYLYLGLRDPKRGYSVCKTGATGTPPYEFTTVVPPGAHSPNPSYSVISMFIYKGRMYVGTDRPGEVIRINPDDSWDLVCGAPRETPSGWKYPISGLDTGFGNWLNAHIWRMMEHRGRLYIGTWNLATDFRRVEGAEDILNPHLGFDLFETGDGWHYSAITTSGFDDRFSNGVRSFASTPQGLFVGTANKWEGLRIWRGVSVPGQDEPEDRSGGLAARNGDTPGDRAPAAARPAAPQRVEIEAAEERVVLSWEHPGGVTRYRIYRAQVNQVRDQVMSNKFMSRMLRVVRSMLFFMPDLYMPPVPGEVWVPEAFQEVATGQEPCWVDTTLVPGKRYQYQVRAEEGGQLSVASNTVSAPSLAMPVTFDSLRQTIDSWSSTGKLSKDAGVDAMLEHLEQARSRLAANDGPGAQASLQQLAAALAGYPEHNA
ncbi:MAG: hypothetical protein ACK2U9_09120, partial [Anaerolineae bacterium]